MKIYQPNASVPAAAITLATHLSNESQQPILFTTQEGYKGRFNKEDKEDVTLRWVIRSITINLVRDWSSSTFEVVLSCSLPDKPNLEIPKLPDVSNYRQGEYAYLDKEDEIRIYMGYIDSPKTPITADLLDQHPFTISNNAANNSKPLCPVFWGFIDKIDFIGDRAGAQLVISGRDRARIFQDTRVVSLRSLERSVTTQKKRGEEKVGVQGARSTILLDIARAAVGQPSDQNNWTVYENSSTQYWKHIIGSKDEEDEAASSLESGDYSYVFSKVRGEGSDVVNPDEMANSINAEEILKYATQKVNSKGFVRFHRWVFRPPIVTRGRNAIYQVFNRVPIDIINYLAANEERPMDFYASHVNGDFLFAPRILDTTGLRDVNRNYRTYFYNSWPRDQGRPSHGQLILKIRAVSSTLGTFNRFSISSSGVSGRGEDTLAALTFILENYGEGLRDRVPLPPARHQLIVDDNLNTYNNALIGATTVAFQSSRSWSRELNAVQMTILGDPTLYPGEAIQIYNSVLHDYQVSSATPSPNAFSEYEKNIENKLRGLENDPEFSNPKEKAEEARQGQPTPIERILELDETSTLRRLTDKDGNRFPIYKCRSIRHRLTTVGQQAGFTTELALVGDL